LKSEQNQCTFRTTSATVSWCFHAQVGYVVSLFVIYSVLAPPSAPANISDDMVLYKSFIIIHISISVNISININIIKEPH